jgi:phosphate-selective porin OprO/OprP
MSKATVGAAIAVGLVAASFVSRAHAESNGNNDAEIAALRQQLRLIEQKLDRLQRRPVSNTAAAANANAKVDAKTDTQASVANANAAYPVKGTVPAADAVVHMPGNRPTICTADGSSCIAITGRIHLDAGGYDYHPNSAATVPQRLDNGVNARRARIGLTGKFLDDWNFALVYDFGGSSDGFASTASVGGTAVGFLPGGALSGLENAYLSYTGFKPFGGTLAIEGGIMDLAYTLDEASSSNDIMFMERASSGIVATNIAAGDFRSAVGARWFNDRFWAGAYATGPSTGAIHSASSTNPNGATEQLGAVARVAAQVVSTKDYTLHIGGDAQFLLHPSQNLVTGAQALTLSDRPELRIDPTTLLTTGALTGVSGAQVYSGEAAATLGSLYLQGEYFWYNIDRNALPGLSSVKFQGGYAQAGYILTGETRSYNPGSASYGGVIPANPFSLTGGGWGAWEIAGRFSTVDLNDQLAAANGVAGGRQNIYTLALNWYVNRNVRFMLDYLHGNIGKQVSPTNAADAGSKFDAFAMRTQVAF